MSQGGVQWESIGSEVRRVGYCLTIPFSLTEDPSGRQRRRRVELGARHLKALLDCMVRNAEFRGDFLGRLML